MKSIIIAKWSSLLSAILFVLAGVTSVLELTIASLIFGFLLVIAFICLVVSIYEFSDGKRLYGILGICFSLMYGMFASFNYFSQLSLLNREIAIPEMLDMSRPDSIFWSIELLAYFFMGLSTLAMIPLFSNNLLEKVIKFIFLLNGILGIGGILGFAFNWNIRALIVGLLVWNVIMPVAAILLYFYFTKLKE